MAVEGSSSTAPSTPAAASSQQSPWNSPVPYLFGGLAAMLVLIVFALLILACSYFKLYNETETHDDVERDLESGNNRNQDAKMENHKVPFVFEDKYLVIMAGQAKPTFLATPVSSRVTSFGNVTMSELEMVEEKEKHVIHESSDQDS